MKVKNIIDASTPSTGDMSAYGYWVDRDSNVIPVSQSEEHSGVAQRVLGSRWQRAMNLGWVRVSVYKTSGFLYFEYDPDYGLPCPAQLRVLSGLAQSHNLKLFNEVTQKLVEGIRPTWAERFGTAPLTLKSKKRGAGKFLFRINA